MNKKLEMTSVYVYNYILWVQVTSITSFPTYPKCTIILKCTVLIVHLNCFFSFFSCSYYWWLWKWFTRVHNYVCKYLYLLGSWSVLLLWKHEVYFLSAFCFLSCSTSCIGRFVWELWSFWELWSVHVKCRFMWIVVMIEFHLALMLLQKETGIFSETTWWDLSKVPVFLQGSCIHGQDDAQNAFLDISLYLWEGWGSRGDSCVSPFLRVRVSWKVA